MEYVIDVALPLPHDLCFSYLLESHDPDLKGRRVDVPLGRGQIVTGVVVKSQEAGASSYPELKKALKIIDPHPIFPQDLFDLAEYMSRTYFISLGEAFHSMLSSKARPPKKKYRPDNQDLIIQAPGFDLTSCQTEAVRALESEIVRGRYSSSLIFGATGSGKTEVYISLISKALSLGKTAIYLIPEVSLLPQAEERLKKRFGNIVGTLHHQMTPLGRYRTWEKCYTGEIKIILGARSAVFAPLQNLGLIVIDEEHSDSYSQDNAPAYRAHDIAEFRAKANKGVLLLGSATPSTDQVYRHVPDDFRHIFYFPSSIAKTENSLILCDTSRMNTGVQMLSPELREALSDCMSTGHQAIVFINKRGYYRFLYCFDCRRSVSCPDCSLSMVYHFDSDTMKCHMCGRTESVPSACPKCGGTSMKFMGWGTERIEQEITKLFPKARVARLDRDLSSLKGFSADFYERFSTGQIDIGIGTQILVKGFDFPNVSLVCILSLDAMLSFPDYNSAERTLSLLIQASGRGARGDIPCKTMIQTVSPGHMLMSLISYEGYKKFVENEIEVRRKYGYPPFSDFVRIVFNGNDRKLPAENAASFHQSLTGRIKSQDSSICLYPVSVPFYEKIGGKYRYQIVLKGQLKDMLCFLEPYREYFLKNRSKGVHVQVKPVDLL